VEVFFDFAKIKVATSPFIKLWDRVMKKAIIPYNIETRQKEFAKAYELLEDHIKLWKKPAVKTWRYHCLR
jgi:hypothetical protein